MQTSTDISDANPGPDGAPDLETLDWAADLDYRGDASRVSKKPRKKRLFGKPTRDELVQAGLNQPQARQPAQPAQPSVPVKPAQPVAKPGLAIDVSDPATIALTRAFKGGKEKKTCEVTIAGKAFVVKGGSNDSADHVAHSEFLARLPLKGVRVPTARLLTDTEIAGLTAALSKDNGEDAAQLAHALNLKHVDNKSSLGQLSERATGINPDKIFVSAADAAQVREVMDLRARMLQEKTAKDAAWSETYEKLIKKSNGSMVRPLVMKLANASTDADRLAGLAELSKACEQHGQKVLVSLLKDIQADRIAASLADLQQEEVAQKKSQVELTAFAKSKEGVEAFSSMAIADLVTGMHDRVMGEFNGGNFMFDAAAGELVCVDNAKDPDKSLSSADNGAWTEYFRKNLSASESLEDMVFRQVYLRYRVRDTASAGKKKPAAGSQGEEPEMHDPGEGAASAPSNYARFDDKEAAEAKDTIRKLLGDIVDSIAGDANQGQAAKDRAAILKARMELDGIFRDIAAAQPPAAPAKLSVAEKAQRSAKSFFTSNKKDQRNDTQKVKDELRAGTISAADARARLKLLAAKNAKLPNDQRGQKIEYLAAVTEYCEGLMTAAADVKALFDGPLKNTLAPEGAASLNATLAAPIQRWETALAGDKKMMAQVSAAFGTLRRSIPSA